jgi:hypothetical protein
MEVIGKIKVVGQPVEVSSTFTKCELVVSTDDQYPQHILINFIQDKCDLLHNVKVGENVKVSINIRGREWTSPQGEVKYFNDIQGWRIEKVINDKHPAQAPQPTYPARSDVKPDNSIADDNDLPF